MSRGIQPVAVMAQRNAPTGPRHRILIILAAAWIAVSLAIGGWVMPDDDGGPPRPGRSRQGGRTALSRARRAER